MEKADKEISQTTLAALRLKNAVEFGRLSFDQEEKRSQSLISHSGHMLTAFSLYSAALLALLSSLLSNSIISRTHLFIFSTLIALPLLSSLVFTMIAQWRFKYEALVDACAFYKEFTVDSEHYREQYQFDYQMIVQLHMTQKSRKKVNDIRLFCINAAMLCFFASIGMLIVAYIFLSIVYTKGA